MRDGVRRRFDKCATEGKSATCHDTEASRKGAASASARMRSRWCGATRAIASAAALSWRYRRAVSRFRWRASQEKRVGSAVRAYSSHPAPARTLAGARPSPSRQGKPRSLSSDKERVPNRPVAIADAQVGEQRRPGWPRTDRALQESDSVSVIDPDVFGLRRAARPPPLRKRENHEGDRRRVAKVGGKQKMATNAA